MDAKLEQLFTIQETLDRLSATGLDKNSAETATDKDPWSSKSSLDSTPMFRSHPTLFPSLSSHGTSTNKVLPRRIQSNTGLMSQGVAFFLGVGGIGGCVGVGEDKFIFKFYHWLLAVNIIFLQI